MSSFTLHINDGSAKAQTFIDFLRDYVKDNVFVDIEDFPNETTLKSIKDIEKGNVFQAKDADDLFKQLDL
ncbi:MAG: hypothetical protein DRJ05_05565 [Bacteroidetes bacterium]|nr:MAG: hypothetical protein DRJ05_05565 [Bacteroidota bacterium]